MGTLGPKAIKKISGPAWDDGREKIMEIFDCLLGVAPEVYGELTTIYVKCSLTEASVSPVYAVVWIKSSKTWLIGLALPEIEHPLLGPAPPQKCYTGLTRYFEQSPDMAIPKELSEWARMAYGQASGKEGGEETNNQKQTGKTDAGES